MASVSSTSSSTSSTNSLYNTYGNANAVTGLASGLDTESMIEQAVSGYQTKIETLQQKQTQVQWKQTELRGFITSLNNLSNDYASYKSKTNLSSTAFFTGAVTNSVTGAYADKVSAVGGSSSTVEINAVTKLATSASYQVNAGALFGGASGTGEAIDWDDLSAKFGDPAYADRRVTVTLDGASKSIRFGDLAADSLDGFKSNLQDALDGAFGSDHVTVSLSNGALKFGAMDGSTVKAESDVLALGLGSGVSNYLNTTTTVYNALGESYFRVKAGQDGVVDNGDDTYTYNGATYAADGEGYLHNVTTNDDGEQIAGDYLHEAKSLTINGARINVSTTNTIAGLLSDINLSGAGVTASYSQLTNQITFTATETGAGSKIEFGGELEGLFQADNSETALKAGSVLSNIAWDENGDATLAFTGPGLTASAGRFTLNRDDTMETLIGRIESLSNGAYAGMIRYENGSYNLYDGAGNALDGSRFSIVQYDTSARKVVSGSGATLAEAAKSANSLSSYTDGEDAQLTVTVNGQKMEISRASNSFDIDGMTVTVKDRFNYQENEDGSVTAVDGDPVTFASKVDTDGIVSAVKSFVEDYNSLMKSIHDAYTTQPLEKSSSSHEKYKPLTDADKEGMSEKTIAEYEEKAKTGLLFGDSDLSSLYSKLRGLLMTNKSALAEIGISVEYESQSRTNFLSVDEDKLAAALEGDVGKVATVFTGNDGSSGLMGAVASTVKTYASTSAAGYGILVRKAGADESATSQLSNTLQKEIDSYDDQIDKWKNKLSTKIDYYTRQFSLLEQLMSTYNNQSSMLASMMGY